MSSRQLRKLQKQRELQEASKDAVRGQESEDSGEDEGPAPAVKPRVSLFAALGADGDDSDEQDEERERDEDDGGPREEEVVLPQSQPSKKSKKKKKKKSKAKAAAASGPEPAGEEEDQGGEDEIDKALKELRLSNEQISGKLASEAQSSGPARRINELLSINTYHLKVINEMRNLFGRDVIESANAEEQEEANRRTRARNAPRQVDIETFLRSAAGPKKLPEVSLRRNAFIQGREHWPRRTAGGLTMKQLRQADDGSFTEYTYVHEAEHDGVQAAFYSYVQMGDPWRLVYLLAEVPYHVSTLIQVSSVAKQDQNMALAAELCERALFTFGRVATSSFRQDIEQGRARLDFRRPENRQFWLAGYHYLKSLIRKGTYRTALEWAKLLFALDPKDPYAMRHFIHFLAIRAHEARWLVDFVDELERTSDNRDTAYLRQSVVLAKLQMNDTAGARDELRRGMQRVPWLYCALYQELGLDAPPSIWGISSQSDSRSFWVKLYIYQMKDLWNNTAAISLLQQVAKGLDRVDASSLPSDDAPPDLGATRLAYLEGQTSLLAVSPRELLDRQPNYEYDPLPPLEEENIFTCEGCRLPWREREDRANGPRGTPTAGILHMLRRRLQRGRVAGGGVMGGGGGAEDEDVDEDEIDDELIRELEGHAERGDERGMLEALMQFIRGQAGTTGEEGGGEGGAGDDDNEEDLADYEHDGHGQEGDWLPGAWPGDEDGR
ncbi:hypothetical protein ACRE_058000 [Hapsidospora chrysogenum ATCC 11550]|uniref:Transcription factor 25 n=1 Tax=Hapsidospora chrysogenum (strain ATCC 11550 / CBS 779.69 / DSM 880 / IAM 14645 / JCM 23072 / IMI 49137) TaxID=857340 RepID=A0A086T246_HAPC1|nr:hypothetical protein ACRE_058000 [Hapsidospora chrysogenum ATCC 11550]